MGELIKKIEAAVQESRHYTPLAQKLVNIDFSAFYVLFKAMVVYFAHYYYKKALNIYPCLYIEIEKIYTTKGLPFRSFKLYLHTSLLQINVECLYLSLSVILRSRKYYKGRFDIYKLLVISSLLHLFLFYSSKSSSKFFISSFLFVSLCDAKFQVYIIIIRFVLLLLVLLVMVGEDNLSIIGRRYA